MFLEYSRSVSVYVFGDVGDVVESVLSVISQHFSSNNDLPGVDDGHSAVSGKSQRLVGTALKHSAARMKIVLKI